MKQKYPDLNQLQALMSLTYFEDAEKGLDPIMLKLVDWDEVKNFLKDEARSYR